jgi:hypothetical protein
MARTAWMRDDTPGSAPAGPQTPTSGSLAGGLNLSALRGERTPVAETDEEALARQFREQIDAQFATAPEPRDAEPERPPTAGLNLSALRNEDNAAKEAALAVLLAAGPAGTGASAIARALADEHGTTRQTVVGWLKTWADEGVAVRVGEGTKTRYVHHRHAPEAP